MSAYEHFSSTESTNKHPLLIGKLKLPDAGFLMKTNFLMELHVELLAPVSIPWQN